METIKIHFPCVNLTIRIGFRYTLIIHRRTGPNRFSYLRSHGCSIRLMCLDAPTCRPLSTKVETLHDVIVQGDARELRGPRIGQPRPEHRGCCVPRGRPRRCCFSLSECGSTKIPVANGYLPPNDRNCMLVRQETYREME